MTRFIKVAKVQQMHDHRATLVAVDGEEIALFRRDGEIYAINNVCSHQHFSMLHQGQIEEFEVICPMHGWKYDIRTGNSTTGQGRVASYKTKVVGEDILIELPDPA